MGPVNGWGGIAPTAYRNLRSQVRHETAGVRGARRGRCPVRKDAPPLFALCETGSGIHPWRRVGECLETLHGTFHRLRQSAIDEELFDVVAGFEALPRLRGRSGASPGR
jgi:hypothetical protein